MTGEHTSDSTAMLFSVVVPAYNAGATLADCLNALVSQPGYRPGEQIEVIVVDDGSADDTSVIARQFPVRLITLEKNLGRIVARRTGVEAARCERILLVDTRVTVSDALFDKLREIDYAPLMAGNLNQRPEGGGFALLFFILKRWYYRPYFPQTEYAEELWIDQHNFLRAPKGTTCLFIDRQLFLDALPVDQGKDVNDDTRLFEYIVKVRGIRLLRHTGVAIRYAHREEVPELSHWLFERGVRFADFMLVRKLRYLFVLLSSLLLLAAAVVVVLVNPSWAVVLFALLLMFYTAATIYFSQSVREFWCVFRGLYLVGLIFWAGSIVGLYGKLKKGWVSRG